jgi:hypothetical protein
MSHFNLKSLTFYGVAISSVVILFKIVTVYGEKNLKAPPAIQGAYRIPTQHLSHCLKADELTLKLEQSGIYLSGFLLPSFAQNASPKNTDEKPSLSGKWQNKNANVTLSGLVPGLNPCLSSHNAISSQTNQQLVNVKAYWEQDTLKGQLYLGDTKLNFTAQREGSETVFPEQH